MPWLNHATAKRNDRFPVSGEERVGVRSAGDLEWVVKTSLVFGMGSGGGCQDGPFEGTKHFGCRLRDIDIFHGFGMPKGPVNPVPL